MRGVYEALTGERLTFYTTLHGFTFDVAARQVINAETTGRRAVYASFSAAHWIAPYGRMSTRYFYAEAGAVESLRQALKLSSVASGANVVITVPKEQGLFKDAVRPSPDVVTTSPVQTYLDLAIAGERGGEAADHLRKEVLTWRK